MFGVQDKARGEEAAKGQAEIATLSPFLASSLFTEHLTLNPEPSPRQTIFLTFTLQKR